MMQPDDNATRPDMLGEVRLRVPLIFVIPFAALALIAIVVIGFSRVLLSLPKEAATIVAMVTAANVLIACAFLALRRVERVSVLEIVLIALYPVFIGVVIAQTGFGAEEEAAAGGTERPAAAAPANALVASGVAWDTDMLELDAGKPTEFSIENEDGAAHNLAIYKSEQESTGGDALYTSPDVEASSSKEFTIDPLKKGEYYFHCDYHPSMSGTVEVS